MKKIEWLLDAQNWGWILSGIIVIFIFTDGACGSHFESSSGRSFVEKSIDQKSGQGGVSECVPIREEVLQCEDDSEVCNQCSEKCEK